MKKKKSNIVKNKGVRESLLFSFGVAILTTIVILAIVLFLGSLFGSPTHGPRYGKLQFFEANILVNTIASVVLLFVMANYFSIYFKTKAKFSLGLIAMAIALMVHTLTANPIVMFLFGFKEPSGLFSLISSIFTLVAAIVLLYLSRE
jgi:hypothetical protein